MKLYWLDEVKVGGWPYQHHAMSINHALLSVPILCIGKHGLLVLYKERLRTNGWVVLFYEVLGDELNGQG
jgi:hypothetical protein